MGVWRGNVSNFNFFRASGRGIRVLERFAVIRLKIIYATARVKHREIRNEKANCEARRISRPDAQKLIYSRFGVILNPKTMVFTVQYLSR